MARSTEQQIRTSKERLDERHDQSQKHRTIEGNPARAAGAKGIIVKSVIMADGRTIKPGQVD